MKFLSQLKKLPGKICLLRVDFNVDSAKDALRLEASLPTIKFLLKKGAKVVILSHRGRPLGRGSTRTSRGPTQKTLKEFSLRFAANFLERRLKTNVVFLSYERTNKILRQSAFSQRESARILLLENLRFWPEEEANDLNFAKKLANLAKNSCGRVRVAGDREAKARNSCAFYVNDAFAVCHRENSSVTQLPKLLPVYAGFLLEKEIKILSAAMAKPKKPLVLIFGGAKVEDKLPVIKNLMPKADKVLLGSSILNAKELRSMNYESGKILKPVDWLAEGDLAFDVGPLTVGAYEREIKKAGTIIWNGPVGKFEDKKYRKGSEAIAKAITKSRAFSIVGGGETTTLFMMVISNFNPPAGGLISKKKIFLSTGGGAMLEFLAGKKLPGIEALK